MGRAIEAVAEQRGAPIVARIDRSSAILPATLHGAEVAIDFTEPRAAVHNVRECLAAGCAVVVGTTGWYDALPEVRAAVAHTHGRLLWAPNFSIGVNALLAITETAGRVLRDAGFAAHLVETHHAAKKDAPSGTAIALAQALQHGFGAAIATTSVRVGSVPGTHELLFDAPYEQIRLTHEARDRAVFAEGALVAARWLAGRAEPGIYTMRDVLGLPQSNGGGTA
jgi:4-hydroxy-tetrahydrodipicolinate reductase